MGNHEALALQGRPPLDPSTRLRVSGPLAGMDSGSVEGGLSAQRIFVPIGGRVTGVGGSAGGVEAFGSVAQGLGEFGDLPSTHLGGVYLFVEC